MHALNIKTLAHGSQTVFTRTRVLVAIWQVFVTAVIGPKKCSVDLFTKEPITAIPRADNLTSLVGSIASQRILHVRQALSVKDEMQWVLVAHT